jgi:hypothetical protein
MPLSQCRGNVQTRITPIGPISTLAFTFCSKARWAQLSTTALSPMPQRMSGYVRLRQGCFGGKMQSESLAVWWGRIGGHLGKRLWAIARRVNRQRPPERERILGQQRVLPDLSLGHAQGLLRLPALAVGR